jgi:hypothetical protein
MKDEDVVWQSSAAMIKGIEETTIWTDIKSEIMIRITQIHEAMEDEELPTHKWRQLQGAAKAYRQMLNLPDDVAHNIDNSVRHQQRERERRNNNAS